MCFRELFSRNKDGRGMAGRRACDPIAAIAAAKRRAKDKHTANITCRSSIVLGRGEGRATRELEVKWFPHIYRKDLECGKLCLRFYVAKFRFS